MQAQLQRLRDAQRAGGFPNADTRKERLQRCIDLLVENQDDLVKALDEDYGGRSPYLSRFTDVMMPIGHLKHAIKHVEKWMKPEKRAAMFPWVYLARRRVWSFSRWALLALCRPGIFPWP